MKISRFRAINFRSFSDSKDVNLKNMNVIIGANNSGKSSILRALHLIQQGIGDSYSDVRVGSTEAKVDIDLINVTGTYGWANSQVPINVKYRITISSSDRRLGVCHFDIRFDDGSMFSHGIGDQKLPCMEPHNAIIPFLSKRKTNSYNEDVREQFVKSISTDLSTLSAKLIRAGNINSPSNKKYAKACEEILGFVLTFIPSPNGQEPGIYLPDNSTLPVSQMGDGVSNIAYLLTYLATSKNKIFLIEEPENDLHPTALKALLDLIIESAKENQFIISTHSNIVVRHLCGTKDSCLFKVSTARDVLPHETNIEFIEETPSARLAVLQELGYSFSDFDLWDGWLILEESSAERIIRDFIIPWFAPKLSRIRTISANGIDSVEPTVQDFMRMVLYTHLEPVYEGKCWVRVDNDEPGKKVVDKLKSSFKNWSDNKVKVLTLDQFEKYYPNLFKNQVDRVLAVNDRKQKREEKKKLFETVQQWLSEDENRGKEALSISAADLILDLQEIEKELKSPIS